MMCSFKWWEILILPLKCITQRYKFLLLTKKYEANKEWKLVHYYDTVLYCRLNHLIKVCQFHRQRYHSKYHSVNDNKFDIFTHYLLDCRLYKSMQCHIWSNLQWTIILRVVMFNINASTSFLLLMFDPILSVQEFFTWWPSQWWLTAVDNDFISMVWLGKIFFLAKRLLF